MTQNLNGENIQIPKSYRICFLPDCPVAERCIRHFAGLQIDRNIPWGPAIYPSSLKNGKCDYFKEKRIIQGAWGFKTLFKDVRQRDSALLHNAIRNYLGGNGTYYRYHHGERLLTPEQQTWILELFHQYGYTDHLQFDGCKDCYDW